MKETNRIAIVKKSDCNPLSCGDYLCERVCPVNRKGEPCIKKAEKAVIDEVLCIGCDICVKKCPFNAISIINLPHEINEKIIHQYGKNGFHLYSLPIPMFGKVVGILGKNGIGKSTAIKILAGQLKPNLGKDTEATPDQMIQFFKGTEAQIFFEKVKNNEIKIAYKPQSVETIAKQFKGKVRELLKKIDEKNKLDKIAEQLEITQILDNEISNISGGELQRVAIAATVLKDANVYFFDEPTSYLDIKQRVKVGRFIRSLADENTAVMIIEHDLIILDYLTDLIHIMYGKEDTYGIVSTPKTTRVGINVYLSGFLREENMRFRDHEIKFFSQQELRTASKTPLTSWTKIKKQLGNFSLAAEPGTVNKHEVIGILGENGIGKTSFVKILAEVDKPDSGEIEEKVIVSYKPQYINPESDDLVMNILDEAVQKYENQIIKPLNIEPLLLKSVNQLSGGQLQRVAIASCLQKKANLYLFDEPSAYLDVEQRLLISKIIADIMDKRGTTALVVDHDLLFLDYLSQRLMVFTGIPAKEGTAKGPFTMKEGMSLFLKDLGLTYRRDHDSHRPRINKEGSVKDREQRAADQYYYTKTD